MDEPTKPPNVDSSKVPPLRSLRCDTGAEYRVTDCSMESLSNASSGVVVDLDLFRIRKESMSGNRLDQAVRPSPAPKPGPMVASKTRKVVPLGFKTAPRTLTQRMTNDPEKLD
jgi:hypothetical protein